ncbi:hypothetical protein F0562_034966 [Nyssa sinensis]|uniref:DUF4005 domain-containing protein n=1 Tax=Nyssa sinensis TaxID=561372 RepID=A0A5J5ABG3_9ASTE|nr:hypothetical protein F0562_034966 [Nyssa sinensis]
MGKTSKWIRNFLTGKKEREKNISKQSTSNGTENPSTSISIPPTTPKEKRRWSFRRSSAMATAQKDLNSGDTIATTPPAVQTVLESGNEQKQHAMAVAAATAAAVDAAAAAAQAAAAVIRLTATAGRASAVEEDAAIKIQSVFRSYLARKALRALKGLVKLQALVRGHLVRKQATATLRCIQALVTVQARARAQRIRMAEESKANNQKQMNYRKTTKENRFRISYHEMDRGMQENSRIVEMDLGESKGSTKSRNSYSNNPRAERAEHRFSTHYHSYSKQNHQHISPTPSALTDMSPSSCSGHFEECSLSFGAEQSSPQCYSAVSKPDPSWVPFAFSQADYAESLYNDYPFFPNYMANTESSRAKFRSLSAPKQRPDSLERQPSKRRPSMEGRNVPRAVRMQRSSSHVGSTAQNYQYPWSIKLDRSTVSRGSTGTVLTNTNYSSWI